VAVQPAIAVADLHVKRGDAQVLRGVSLEVAAGAVTGLLGPSGCGKSTLMRAIVGVQIVASGTITVLGRPAGSPALRTQVGYVTRRRCTATCRCARTCSSSAACSGRRRRGSTP
jgi:ABC-2 type transport system ATP-binding protein